MSHASLFQNEIFCSAHSSILPSFGHLKASLASSGTATLEYHGTLMFPHLAGLNFHSRTSLSAASHSAGVPESCVESTTLPLSFTRTRMSTTILARFDARLDRIRGGSTRFSRNFSG